jgi:hypothetical protein
MQDFRDLLPAHRTTEKIPYLPPIDMIPPQPAITAYQLNLTRVLLGTFWMVGWAAGWLTMILPVRFWLFSLGLLVAIASPAFCMRAFFGTEAGAGAIITVIVAWICLFIIVMCRFQ